ncbi:hypothetical protein GCM10027511_32820 [Hymenobacter humi]
MCRRLADDLFLPDDLRAHARGWTVEPIRNGTGRCYRDPRWDRLSACHHCDAAGYRGIDPCPACAGRGVLDSAAAPAVGNGQEERREPLKVTAERLDLRPGEDR